MSSATTFGWCGVGTTPATLTRTVLDPAGGADASPELGRRDADSLRRTSVHVHGVSESSGSLSFPSSSAVVVGLPFPCSSSDVAVVTLAAPPPGDPDRRESIERRPRLSDVGETADADWRFCFFVIGGSCTITCWWREDVDCAAEDVARLWRFERTRSSSTVPSFRLLRFFPLRLHSKRTSTRLSTAGAITRLFRTWNLSFMPLRRLSGVPFSHFRTIHTYFVDRPRGGYVEELSVG